MKTRHVVPFRLWIAFTTAVLFMAAPAQSGGYLHFGFGGHHSSHYGGHYGYDHPYGYGYSYPYYGLHSYYGYGHHDHYDHHSYGYPGYGYSNYGHHYYGYSTPYDSDDGYSSGSSYQNRTYDRRGSPITTGNGWTLLGNNQASAALTDFGRQAQASPSKGDPKVGFALASADLGQLDKGVWAMRRALRVDPHALHYVVLDQQLNTKLEHIIQQYEQKLAYSSNDRDAAFMLASLHYLRRDIKAARSNIHQAMLAPHIRTSTRNLKALIDKERK